MRKNALLFIVVISAIVITSCRKSDRDNDTSTTSSSDHALAENLHNDIFQQVDQAVKDEPGLRTTTGTMACATISVDTNTSPKTLLLDFGNTNCQGPDGRERRGQIYATFTGKYRDSSTVITITPVNYYVNDHKVEGTRTMVNKGTNSNGNLWFTVEVDSAIIKAPDNSWIIQWESSQTREWIAGRNTPLDITDDAYLIEGTASGNGRKGNDFDVVVTTPLRIEMDCPHIVSGVLELSPENLSTRIIDYGNGTCDSEITVTINGVEFIIDVENL